MYPELSEKSVDMCLDCALRDEEHASNLGIWKALAHEGINLSFACRQSRDGVNDRRYG